MNTLHKAAVIKELETVGSATPNFEMMKRAFFTLRSVAHPVRKKILALLERCGRLTVTEIYIKLRVEQSVASTHLAILRAAGTVKTERNGKFIYYSLNKDRIAEIAHYVEGLASE